MAARKKKRELSEKAQKRIRQRNLHVGITVIAAIVIIFFFQDIHYYCQMLLFA